LYLINKIEWVQKSFTKRFNGLSARSYSDRLIWLGADSLSTRGLKFDVVLFYDIVHDNIDVDLPLLDIVDPNVTHTRIPVVIHLRSLSNGAELMLG